MANNRSKFSFISVDPTEMGRDKYDRIKSEGKIDPMDIIFIEETEELFYLDSNDVEHPITAGGGVKQFETMSDVDLSKLEAGQVVTVKDATDKYRLYTVQEDGADVKLVEFLPGKTDSDFITTIKNITGEPASLGTIAKANLVAAVNEVNTKVGTNATNIATNTANITQLNTDLTNLTAKVKNVDWTQNDTTKPDYVKNRTHYVKADGTVEKLDNKYLKDDVVVTNSLMVGTRATGSATGTRSAAIGYQNNVSGENASAFGYKNESKASASFAAGYNNKANGLNSTSVGRGNSSTGRATFTANESNMASNEQSFASGYKTTASGLYSNSQNYNTTASGNASSASGIGTIAQGTGQTVFGKYNVADRLSIEIVGGGTSASNRKNLRTLDSVGKETLADTLVVARDPAADMEVVTKQYLDTALSWDTTTSVDFQSLTEAQFNAIATKDVGTFYYVNNKSKLYFGNVLLSSGDDVTSVLTRITQAETDIDTLEAAVGTLSSLSTTAKSNLVAAINELKSKADTDRTNAKVTLTEQAGTGDVLKKYIVKQGATEVGTINLAKDIVVQSGQVVVDPTGQPAGTYIELTLSNAAGSKIYINVADLASTYTAQGSAAQVQVAISASNEISATLVAGSIGATELANNAVTTAKIANNAITSAKIADGTINSADLADNSITAAKINNGAVTKEKIASGAIDSSLIADGSITAAKFATGAVTNAKLGANSVTADKIADGTVGTAELGASVVTTAKIADNAVTSDKILDGSVTSSKIGTGAVGTSSLAASSVTTAKLDDASVTEDKVASNAISTAKIKDGAVTEDKIAANSVTSGKIADNSITSSKIADGTIVADDLAANSITTTKVVDGAITEDKLATAVKNKLTFTLIEEATPTTGSTKTYNLKQAGVSLGKVEIPKDKYLKSGSIVTLAAGAVSGLAAGTYIKFVLENEANPIYVNVSSLTGGTGGGTPTPSTTYTVASGATQVQLAISAADVISASLVDGGVTTSKIAANAVTSAKITDGAVTTDKVADGSITTAKFASGALASALGNGSITTAKIADGGVTTAKIANNAITNAKLADGSVTSAKIVDGTIVADDIADGTITEAKLATALKNKLSITLSAASPTPSDSAVAYDLKQGSTTLGTIKVPKDKYVESGSLVSLAAGDVGSLPAGTYIKLTIKNEANPVYINVSSLSGGSGGSPVLYSAASGGTEVQLALSASNAFSASLVAGGITTSKIADGAITTDKIASGAVTSAKIADSAITEGKIATSAVTTSKIKDAAVTAAKIATGAVGTNQIANNAITTGKIADGAVGTVDLAASAVTTAKIADGSITTDKLDSAVKASLDKADEIGTLSSLNTTDKTNLVSAINEVNTAQKNKAVIVTSSTSGTVKTYTFKQGGTQIGAINVPQDMVVTGGSVVVNPTGQTAGTYLALTISGQTSPVYINVQDLASTYTAASGATQVQLAISASNELSATLVDGGISTAKIANGAVTSAKIADGTIATADIANGAITSAKIADGTISAGDIASNAITTAKINNGAITSAKLDSTLQTAITKAGSSIQTVATGTTNGTLAVDGTDVAVKGYSALETQSNTNKTSIGTLSGLTTTAKGNLVAAVNEVKASIPTVSVTQKLASGTEIGSVKVNGTVTKLYSPSPLTTLNSATDSAANNNDLVGAGVIKDLKKSFQDGCDTIYNAIVSQGVTPASKSPSDIASSVESVKISGYSEGHDAITGTHTYKYNGAGTYGVATTVVFTNVPVGRYILYASSNSAVNSNYHGYSFSISSITATGGSVSSATKIAQANGGGGYAGSSRVYTFNVYEQTSTITVVFQASYYGKVDQAVIFR